MLSNKFVNCLLDHTPQRYWNTLSNVISRLSLPTIGSPIRFRYQGFTLEEYAGENLTGEALEKFIAFTYPPGMPDREREIELDSQYWPFASTFLISDSTGEVVGCIQFVMKRTHNRLPVEFGIAGSSAADDRFRLQQTRSSEIYRCKRAESLKGSAAFSVVNMMFKAVNAKAVQTETVISCISYDSRNRLLRNLYKRKLAFDDSGLNLSYGTEDKWRLLYKDWPKHERTFASLSKSHFYLQTFWREGLKKKNLTSAHKQTASANKSSRHQILFAQVLTSRKIRLRGLQAKTSPLFAGS